VFLTDFFRAKKADREVSPGERAQGTGTIHRVNAQTMPRILESLKDAARHLSMQLGYHAPRRAISAPVRFQPRPGISRLSSFRERLAL